MVMLTYAFNKVEMSDGKKVNWSRGLRCQCKGEQLALSPLSV